MEEKELQIGLLGNPNSGKSSLFNVLTGLNQKVGNFPGVTVEKKTGKCKLETKKLATIVDLPGSYSLYPRRTDEWVAYKAIIDPIESIPFDVIVIVVDASNLKRNLLYASQIIDLQKPVIVALSMMDIAKYKGITIDINALEKFLKVPVIPINPRKNKGIDLLKQTILELSIEQNKSNSFVDIDQASQKAVSEIHDIYPQLSEYAAIHYLINHESFQINQLDQEKIEKIEINNKFNPTKVQADEIIKRYSKIKNIIHETVVEKKIDRKSLTDVIDNVLLHRVWGYVIMLVVLFLLFQGVFLVAEYPMNAIEWIFSELNNFLSQYLPQNALTNIITNGIIAGLSGVFVFVPQIMILFGIFSFLEDTGYMARISFLSDKVMRKVGMNGKSVMPMISGFACAVPAIMSTRNIENKKERLLTILITPLMSCSARLPIFTVLIALVIPKHYIAGFISIQGLVMMGLYTLGLFTGLLVSYIFNMFITIKEKTFFILELPLYRPPRIKNILQTMLQKAKVFVFDAGKIIMIISLILWILCNYSPGEKRKNIIDNYTEQVRKNPKEENLYNIEKESKLLENSYAGISGKWIEPIIKPLGFDWKIGIAIITSFAAREVFVGTMATLYSVGKEENETQTLREKMFAELKPDGTKRYDLATGLSLLFFYVFAMQCMSTFVVVKKETGGWKWPIIQLVFMTILAYSVSLITYQLLK
ncbi:MAG: ferrous iron transport protein B [Chitinophagaceae bacterium]|nr:ferrous iron transport protein B [Chitinophagaceae bacterium]